MTGALTGALSAALGIGGSGHLAKLTITPEDGRGEIVAAFNPSEIKRSRTVAWSPTPAVDWAFTTRNLHYGGPTPETLSLTLLFDTYEKRSGAGLGQQLISGIVPGALLGTPHARPVTDLTDAVAALADEVPRLHRPPTCALHWGTHHAFFTGVLTALEQTLTMFLPDGTPVRATLACTFLELLDRKKEKHSPDVDRTRTVRRGETLHDLAAQEYEDPALWRHIARANGIVDPLAVSPGDVLHVPRLTG